ncbi:hypothetical protein DSCO28_66310 [Desulfosarcina ovata subsp. sediminis]|uniref:histidine kinase n=1 Tax=Desulfosarcina ovata subsp. sediminis TaxID=885957 RepID=A0A5K8A0I9_9BACT|nr:ATP-binding protein [Desulfosarcina ovata]BBO86065.1 hypothetical protein DSCO28_66310 [Desulfosarcina ovata subsp. sediminis]
MAEPPIADNSLPESVRHVDNCHDADREPEAREAFRVTRQTCEDLYRKYASLFDFAPIGYIVVDREDMIHELNLSAAISLNAPRAKLTGHCFTDFIHQDDLAGFDRKKKKCRKNLETPKFELKMKRTDGTLFDAQLQMQSISSRRTDASQYSIALVDISEHVQLSSSFTLLQDCLEVAIQAKSMQALLDAFVQVIKSYLKCDAVGIRIRDDFGNIPYQSYDGFSQAFLLSERQMNSNPDQCLCMDVVKGRSVPDGSFCTTRGSVYFNAAPSVSAASTDKRTTPVKHRCNASGYESLALVPIRIDTAIRGVIHVVDRRPNVFSLRVVENLENVAQRLGLALQRFQLEQKLCESVDTLNALSSHLLSVQEDEQRRIAMELHDGCGQDLNVLKLRLKFIRDRCPADRGDLIGAVDDLMTDTGKIINDIRMIAHNLNPATLEALGLTVAIRQTITEFSAYTAIPVDTDIDLLDRIRDPKHQICLFRIFQEALLNVYKHARATRIWVTVRSDEKRLRIELRDNGTGFDVSKQSTRTGDPKGMGLSTLALRCRMIAARLSINSRPGKGTRLTITLPLPDE